MTTTKLKKKIHACIDHIDDNKILEAVYTIINTHSFQTDFELSASDIKILEARKKAVKKGKEKTYTVAEVKKKLMKSLGK
jgi:hypothetical protein